MNAWLSLDFVAKRYGVLPSVVLDSGYNTDMICASLAVGYENYVAGMQREGKDPTKAQPTQEELLAMIQRVKDGKGKGNKK